MPTPNRTLITAGLMGLVFAVAGCSKADQQKTNSDAQAAASDVKSSASNATEDVKADAAKLGADVKDSAKKTGNDLKAIGKDPEVKKAANELKGSLKDLGRAVKDASHKDHAEGDQSTLSTTATVTTEKKTERK